MSIVKRDAPLTLRRCREILALSQLEFATQLGVHVDTYRAWDSGRRSVRDTILARARALAGQHDRRAPLSLDTLALMLDVHVRTLRTAARDGRLSVTYNTVAFGKPVPRATVDAGERFMREFYKSYRWGSTVGAPLRSAGGADGLSGSRVRGVNYFCRQI